jgi:hypothetical protein
MAQLDKSFISNITVTKEVKENREKKTFMSGKRGSERLKEGSYV